MKEKDRQINEAIQKRTAEAGKTYSFDNLHNPKLPSDHWFQYTPEGLCLFLVLYTSSCRWAKCLSCNLPSKEADRPISFKEIMNQIDFVFHYLLSKGQKNELRKIILSNNGSVLDETTFSTTALVYFIAKVNVFCPNVTTISMETRPEYVDFPELVILDRVLKEGNTKTTLEIAIGFEAFDEKIRNDHFMKGLSFKAFEDFCQKLTSFDFKLKCYFMQKPVPGMTDEEAVQDIKNAIDYLENVSRKYDLDINLHLNPTYVAKGTILEEEFARGSYSPPKLKDVVESVKYSNNKRISMYVGLNDEGLSVEGGSFIRPGEDGLLSKIELFNETQDYSVFD